MNGHYWGKLFSVDFKNEIKLGIGLDLDDPKYIGGKEKILNGTGCILLTYAAERLGVSNLIAKNFTVTDTDINLISL